MYKIISQTEGGQSIAKVSEDHAFSVKVVQKMHTSAGGLSLVTRPL